MGCSQNLSKASLAIFTPTLCRWTVSKLGCSDNFCYNIMAACSSLKISLSCRIFCECWINVIDYFNSLLLWNLSNEFRNIYNIFFNNYNNNLWNNLDDDLKFAAPGIITLMSGLIWTIIFNLFLSHLFNQLHIFIFISIIIHRKSKSIHIHRYMYGWYE